MKVLVVHNAYRVRGGEDACVEHEAQALGGAGLDVELLCLPTAPGIGAWKNASLAPLGRGAVRQVMAALETFRPDVLHAHNLFPSLSPLLFPAAKRAGSATVQSLHNFRPLCLNGLYLTPGLEICERCSFGHYLPGIERGCYRGSRLQSMAMAAHLWHAAKRKWYEHVDCFIAPSEFLKAKYEAFQPFRGKVVHQSHFLPGEETLPPVFAQDYALYLGRLSQEKGVSWLLDRFKGGRLPLKLVLAGDGPLKPQVQALRTEVIEYRGYVQGQDKIELLRKAAVLLLPSECYENAPLALMEANRFGVPVLAAAHGGLQEHVRSGINGETYPLHDEQAFTSRLAQFSAVSRSLAHRKACQAYTLERYSVTRFVDARMALYERACAANFRRL